MKIVENIYNQCIGVWLNPVYIYMIPVRIKIWSVSLFYMILHDFMKRHY